MTRDSGERCDQDEEADPAHVGDDREISRVDCTEGLVGGRSGRWGRARVRGCPLRTGSHAPGTTPEWPVCRPTDRGLPCAGATVEGQRPRRRRNGGRLGAFSPRNHQTRYGQCPAQQNGRRSRPMFRKSQTAITMTQVSKEVRTRPAASPRATGMPTPASSEGGPCP